MALCLYRLTYSTFERWCQGMKVGLFSGGMDWYWKKAGMKSLPEALDRDIRRLKKILEERGLEVFYPGFAGNEEESERAGKAIRKEGVDIALVYHAAYIEDDASLAFLDQLGDIFPVIFLSQGPNGFSEIKSVIDEGRCGGVNSKVQIVSTLKRLRPNLRFGFVFGKLDDPEALREIEEWAKAARAVRKLHHSKIAFLPHRSEGCSMYDTFPDEAKMIAQTGVRIIHLYIQDLINAMKKVSEEDTDALTNELYEKNDVVEPPKDEVRLAAKQALALEMVVKENKIDALAIDTGPGLMAYTGMLPCVGMARLIDEGFVVTSEGDLSVAVSGLILQELSGGKPIHFWEHLAFDAEKNLILGGHEGGSAGFTMAKKGTRPRLRSTQYVNFGGISGAPYYGVVPEFITDPGPVTLLTLFRCPEAYEMRLAIGESVDADPFEAHHEQTIFKPNVPLRQYFNRIAEIGVCHHFGLVHADVASMVKKVAHILGMRLEYLTSPTD